MKNFSLYLIVLTSTILSSGMHQEEETQDPISYTKDDFREFVQLLTDSV